MYTLEEILKERLKYGITNTLVIESYLRRLDNYKMLFKNDKALFFNIYHNGKRIAQAYIVYGPEQHWRFCVTNDTISNWPKFNEIFTEECININTIDNFIN